MDRYYRNLVITFLIISLGMVFANVKFKKEVTIIDNEEVYRVKTLKRDMEAVFNACGIVLSPSDKIAPSMDTALSDGMEIQVVRAFPVQIVIGDEVIEHDTTLSSVRAILDEAKIQIETLDKVYPSLDHTIKGDRKIEVVQVEKKIIDHTSSVAYNVEMHRTDQLKSGMIEEKEVGIFGQTGEKVEVLIENGHVTSKEVKEWSYAKEPHDALILKGQEKYVVLDDGTPYRYLKVLDMTASAYDLSYASCGKYPDHPQYGITYLGTQARPGVVAVDPNTIKLRSKLYVESLDRMADYGFSSAEDTGSAIKSNRIDLFINNNRQAMRFGLRRVRVYVLEDGFDESLMVGYSR
jgi:3D (Asp-Asp-Asp) domain-containing protein